MRSLILTLSTIFVALVCVGACDSRDEPISASGVSKANVHVITGSDGLTVEQRNITDRLKADNLPGSIKHLYVISAYSGQVLIYSTVRGKVTSGSKRLTPSNVIATNDRGRSFDIDLGGHNFQTGEVLSDDGAYGGSVEYIYWWDTKDVYHQHYVQGGQILHISSEPLAVHSVVINMAEEKSKAGTP